MNVRAIQWLIIPAVVGAFVFTFLVLENNMIMGNTSLSLQSTSEVPLPMPSLPLFDKMHKELHEIATLPHHNAERKTYKLRVYIP